MPKTPYYGWYIAVVAVLANFMAVGSGFYALNAFLEPVSQMRAWSRTDINLAVTLGTFCGFVGQFVYGTLVARIGPRVLMSLGALGAGVSFIFLFRMSSLWQFHLFYIFLFVFNGAYGGIVANTAVSNWFVAQRGKALGLTTAGISLSGAVLPFLAMVLILEHGVETAALIIGLAMLCISPIAWLVVRDWPEKYGMAPDGAGPPGAPLAPTVSGRGDGAAGYDLTGRAEIDKWPLSALIRTDTFWKIGMAYGMMMIGVVGVMSQLKPRFSDIGFDSGDAMAMMAVTALIGAAGKYWWGSLCDRFAATRVAAVMAGTTAVGLFFGLCAPNIWTLTIFIVVFGFSMGGVLSTFPIIVAERFGRQAFPRVFRFLYMFLVLQMTGYLISGLSYDLTGTYDAAYGLYIGLYAIACLLMFRVK
ncbi:MAG: MFS transporter [Desulfobacterales bacterium]|nr:MFS transporter [Desulfobacterales bacterium]